MSSYTRSRIATGLRVAIEKGGDVSMIYHIVSMLSPRGYYEDLPYPEPTEYYKTYSTAPRIRLPEPLEASGMDLFEAIRSRRSRRRYSRGSLSLSEVSTLLYYSLGVTGRAWWGGPKRAYPSAGALQPLEGYLYADKVEGLDNGIYHYNPGEHSLELLRKGNYSEELQWIALDQEHVGNAAAVIIVTAVYRRTASKYSHRSYRYAHWDTGFAGQNIYLVAEALGLATTAVGAFYDEELCKLLELDCIEEFPMILFPIGRR
ncbi:MAG: SagB/ThcOx family dehydrogenase [Desulfurococcales archaeon]|nr:SagB/ThcOx family dehydrogenase [Desulfurococcales archaeon]